MNAYEELEVPRDATAEDVKRAFRKKAAKVHPDKGGSAEDFHRAKRAHDILIDPVRRLAHDIGEDDESPEVKNRREVISIFLRVLESLEDPERADLVLEVRKFILEGQQSVQAEIKSCERKAAKLRATARRLHRKKRKEKGANFVSAAIEAQAAGLDARCAEGKEVLKQGLAMLEMISDFEFDFERAPQEMRSILSNIPPGFSWGSRSGRRGRP